MIKYVETTPTADEFNTLTDSVGWGRADKIIVEKALKNTIYSICVYNDNSLVGFGRLIGDMTMFLYVQDVMVSPEHQGQKIGTHIMEHLINKVNDLKNILLISEHT